MRGPCSQPLIRSLFAHANRLHRNVTCERSKLCQQTSVGGRPRDVHITWEGALHIDADMSNATSLDRHVALEQKPAPRAMALKISDPLRIPPSTAIRIWPFTIGAHCRRASNVAGTPSSWRPPWFEMSTPSTPAAIAYSTSSGVEIPLSQICILCRCALPQGYIWQCSGIH
jgi:hypothetical protein